MYAINAAFEAVGAWLAWESYAALRCSRNVSGIDWRLIGFSALWALECVPYYVSVGHFVCAWIACARCVGCVSWTVLALRLRGRA